MPEQFSIVTARLDIGFAQFLVEGQERPVGDFSIGIMETVEIAERAFADAVFPHRRW
ncbi:MULTISPECIES: hypothetical protein [Mesorhizobium]|uniref:hypothetical protein n=1 Tax=Mesorhizobium TaxID=68287 RepID=UPI0012E3AFCB|nr:MULTISPECIES: hypothetical protein [Mesorhizobium]